MKQFFVYKQGSYFTQITVLLTTSLRLPHAADKAVLAAVSDSCGPESW
jgi:hypothetical protein